MTSFWLYDSLLVLATVLGVWRYRYEKKTYRPIDDMRGKL